MRLEAHICKKLESFMLDVHLKADGGMLGILGASGCGKSMTLKCIAGIDRPDEGRITLGDRVLYDSAANICLPPQKRHIGYLFQNYALFPNMTVAENIAVGAGGSRAERDAMVAKQLAAFRLAGLEHKRPGQLSGGQQQRVALARLLASTPQAILLDEPLSALDSHLRWKVEQELADAMGAFPGSVVVVSHNRDEIYRLCSRVAVYGNGRLDAEGPLEEIFKRPYTVNAAVLTGCKNISRAQRMDAHRVRALDWGMTLRTAQPVTDEVTHVGIRAHFIEASPPGSGSGDNAMEAVLVREIPSPFSTIVLARKADVDGEKATLRVEMDRDCWAALRGPRVALTLPREHVLLLRGEGSTPAPQREGTDGKEVNL